MIPSPRALASLSDRCEGIKTVGGFWDGEKRIFCQACKPIAALFSNQLRLLLIATPESIG